MVSALCHVPRVGLAVLEAMLAPYCAGRQLEVRLRHRPVAADKDGDRIRSVMVRDQQSGDETVIQAPYILDATELGDVLGMADVEHVIGAESQAQTGEPHALDGDPNPLDQQAISWCFALDYLPGEDHVIEKPTDYDFWRSYRADFWPGPQLGWMDFNPETLEQRYRPIFDGSTDRERGEDLWHFRRILYRKHYPEGLYPSDITLVNWPQIDYWLGPLLEISEEEKQKNLHSARQLSLSLLYWMQTEAPRPEGGYGYPGLRLRADVVGTSDGLAKHVYVRESRRIRAEFTVLEQHVGVEARGNFRGRSGSPTAWESAATGLTCTPAPGDATISTSAVGRFRFRSARLFRCGSRTCCRPARTLAAPISPMAATGCTPWNGMWARPLARWRPTAWREASRPARYAIAPNVWRTSSNCFASNWDLSWPGRSLELAERFGWVFV
jgi:hypothetical protein